METESIISIVPLEKRNRGWWLLFGLMLLISETAFKNDLGKGTEFEATCFAPIGLSHHQPSMISVSVRRVPDMKGCCQFAVHIRLSN